MSDDLRSNREKAQSAQDKAVAATSSERAKSGTGGARLVTDKTVSTDEVDAEIARVKAKNEAAAKAEKAKQGGGLGALSAALRKATPTPTPKK